VTGLSQRLFTIRSAAEFAAHANVRRFVFVDYSGSLPGLESKVWKERLEEERRQAWNLYSLRSQRAGRMSAGI
jgi:hypothetical protein